MNRKSSTVLSAFLLALLSAAGRLVFGAAESTNAPPSHEAAPSGSEPSATPKSAESTNSPAVLDFKTFKVIAEKNIFNANRRAGMAKAPPPRIERAPKIDAFSLVGTLLYEEGRLAFFSGTESSFNQVLKQGEMIGGCKIAQVTPDSVKLETGEVETDLPMGMQMRRRDEGKWELIVGAASASSASAGRDRSFGSDPRRDRSSSTNGRSDRSFGTDSRGGRGFGLDSRRDRGGSSGGRRDRASTPETAAEVTAEAKADEAPAGEGGVEDILQKLMQKREQELNK